MYEAKDFNHKKAEMRQNFAKTECLEPRKTSLNTVNFHSSSGQSSPIFHPFSMSLTTSMGKNKLECLSLASINRSI
jgi:hypothetical protein